MKFDTIELAPVQLSQLVDDAAILAAFARIYAPMAQRRVYNAAMRTLRTLKLEAPPAPRPRRRAQR